MKFKTETVKDALIIKIPVTALDAANVMEFKTDIAPYLQNTKHVILNMSKIRFIDSSGIGALLSCMRSMHSSGGTLSIFGVNKQLMPVLRLVRLDRIIDIYDTRSTAIKNIKD